MGGALKPQLPGRCGQGNVGLLGLEPAIFPPPNTCQVPLESCHSCAPSLVCPLGTPTSAVRSTTLPHSPVPGGPRTPCVPCETLGFMTLSSVFREISLVTSDCQGWTPSFPPHESGHTPWVRQGLAIYCDSQKQLRSVNRET